MNLPICPPIYIHLCVHPRIRSSAKSIIRPCIHPEIYPRAGLLPTYPRIIHQHLWIHPPIYSSGLYQHIHNPSMNPFRYSCSHSPIHLCIQLLCEPGVIQCIHESLSTHAPIHPSIYPSIHPSSQSSFYPQTLRFYPSLNPMISHLQILPCTCKSRVLSIYNLVMKPSTSPHTHIQKHSSTYPYIYPSL